MMWIVFEVREKREILKVEYRRAVPYVKHMLKSARELIHFTFDGWTSRQNASFMGMNAHFLNHNWAHRTVFLGLPALLYRRTGIAMADEVAKLQSFLVLRMLSECFRSRAQPRATVPTVHTARTYSSFLSGFSPGSFPVFLTPTSPKTVIFWAHKGSRFPGFPKCIADGRPHDGPQITPWPPGPLSYDVLSPDYLQTSKHKAPAADGQISSPTNLSPKIGV
jgi:hypothetical protein